MAANRNFRSKPGARNRSARTMRRKINNVRSRRNIRKAAPSSSTSIGGLIATGVRTLTSFLPGQTAVRPVVDTILKALGLITNVYLVGDDITASLNVIGLSANIPLNFGNLMCECKNFGLQGVNTQGMPTLRINYDTGRVVRMIITAEPTAKMSERSGEWAMAIVPVKQVKDVRTLGEITPNFEDLKNMPGAKYGSATKPLSVLWIPSVTRDSYAAMNQDFGTFTALAYLMVAFSQEARSSYGNFSPDSFSTRFVTKTFAQFGERMPMDSFTTGETGILLQPNAVKPKSMYVGNYKGKTYHFTDEHVVNTDTCVELRINKHRHAELYNAIRASVKMESLADDFENVSVISG